MSNRAKATSRLGFMKFYPGDWLNDNISLTHEEFGVYMRMAFRYWVRDGLPWTAEDIAEDIGDRGTESVETIKHVLVKKFTKGRGKKWVHRDLDAARSEAREYKLNQSDKGALGNASKHGSEGEKAIKLISGANKGTYGSPSTSTSTATAAPPAAPASTAPPAAAAPAAPAADTAPRAASSLVEEKSPSVTRAKGLAQELAYRERMRKLREDRTEAA